MTGASTSNGPGPDELLDVIVIGAGQAGLAVAWHLAQRGMRFLVLEAADQLGRSWRGRWDSLRLFSPAQYDALPGMAFPAPADTYPGKDAVADFLRDYATRFDLPVRLSKRVIELSRTGDEFHVRTDDEVLRAQQVLVATGPFQNPFTPEAGHGFDGSVTQIHSADYRNLQSLPPGPVLVVGAGNSGLQIAHELVATRPVDVSVGEKVPMLPQRLFGRDLFWWLTRLRFMRVNTETRLGQRLQARTSSACPGSTPAGPHCSGSSPTTRPTSRSGSLPGPRALETQVEAALRPLQEDEEATTMIAPRRRPSSMAHVVDIEDLTWGPRAGWNAPSGRLTTAERRALLRPLARPCGQIAVGRLRLALGVHPGRHAYLPDERITPPTSVLTRAPHCNAR